MIDVFPSDKITPQQSMLQAEEELDSMDLVAIIYIRKGELHPRLTCSSMTPSDMNFLATALEHYSMKYLLE